MFKSYFALFQSAQHIYEKDPEPDPDPHLWLMDPDPGGPRIWGSGSVSPTLLNTVLYPTITSLFSAGPANIDRLGGGRPGSAADDGRLADSGGPARLSHHRRPGRAGDRGHPRTLGPGLRLSPFVLIIICRIIFLVFSNMLNMSRQTE